MDADMANISNAADVDRPELETRVFSTPRLHSYHGYDQLPPQIDDTLKFCLPQISFYHSRLIAVADQQFLVWSPNLTQDPYYPGVYSFPGQVPIPVELGQRWCDGQGGPCDFTKAPQVFRKNRPWLGFIRRERRCGSTDVEYTPVYSVWDNPVLVGGQGRLNPTYLRNLSIRFEDVVNQVAFNVPRIQGSFPDLVKHRPTWPTSKQVKALRAITAYEVAVNELAACQRGIRELRAWLDMVELLINRPPMAVKRDSRILPVDEDYIGVWINRGVEETIHWLLTMARFLCFVIHTFRSNELASDAISDPLSRTDVRLLTDEIGNDHDHLLLRGADGLHPEAFTQEELHSVPRSLVYRQPREREGSSLNWQFELPAAQAIPREILHDSGTLEERNLALWARLVHDFRQRMPDRYLGPGATDFIADTERRFTAYESGVKPPRGNEATEPGSADSGLEDRELEDDDEEEERDLTAMMELGARNQGKDVVAGEEMWFDRTKRCRQIFTDLPPLDPLLGLTTGEEYGRPAPSWPFLYPSNGKYLRWDKSLWMYKKQHPDPLYKGRVAKPPRAEQLPLLKDGSHEPNDGNWAWKTGAEEEDEPEVSLGESGGLKDEGLAVPPAPAPSERQPLLVPPRTISDRSRNASASRRASPFSLETKGRFPSATAVATLPSSAPEGVHLATNSDSPSPTTVSTVSPPAMTESIASSTPFFPAPIPLARVLPNTAELSTTAYSEARKPRLLVLRAFTLAFPEAFRFAEANLPSSLREIFHSVSLDPSSLLHEANSSPGLLSRFTNAPEDAEMEEGEIYRRFGVGLPERVGKVKKPRIRRHNRTVKREARLEHEHLSWLTLQERIFQGALWNDARAQPPPPPPPERTYERDDDFYDTDDE
ncbi:hypothetical protein B0H17DRAFT_1210335 [Mycena rosella]|uniref:Uncharacterized protein n=1 Tax=Mycena rosella TaxID=1033263 RepID=A0AAD7G552_MYCRO|nr:hypothetical protein B0H17DRAFT_1210335 [Mycena rosella]